MKRKNVAYLAKYLGQALLKPRAFKKNIIVVRDTQPVFRNILNP